MPLVTPSGGGVLGQLQHAETSLVKLEELAAILKAHRSEHDLTLNDAARETGISASTLSRIENAKFSPKLETVVALCNWMNISADRFTEFHTEEEFSTTPEKVEVYLRADRKLSAAAAREIINVVRHLYEYHTKKTE